ncbi:TetR/AcrR family transcriptional regulator [Streptomyces pseudogriseolus]
MTTPQLRKDAAHEWERIVAVARDPVDQGTALQLNDGARRAGLGFAMVYRHSATYKALLENVATPCLEGRPRRAVTGGHRPLAGADGLPVPHRRSPTHRRGPAPGRCRGRGRPTAHHAAQGFDVVRAAHVHGGTPGERIYTGHRHLTTLLEGMRRVPPRT